MLNHESILVFGAETPIYNPQGLEYFGGEGRRGGLSENYGEFGLRNWQEFTNYPRTALEFDVHRSTGQHPTQKPVELMRYLVRTYTNPGDTVLDFTMGSGSTGVACVIEGRNFIGIEQEASYCEIAEARMTRTSGVACDIPNPRRRQIATPLFELAQDALQEVGSGEAQPSP